MVLINCGHHCDKLTWRQLLISFFAAIVCAVLLDVFLSQNKSAAAAAPSCLTQDQVASAVTDQKKCLVIFDNKVYDFTAAKRWDLTGHLGQHVCGKVYDKETIEKGPHKVAVMDRFFYANICGTAAAAVKQPGWPASNAGSVATAGWPATIFGMTWFRFSAYLSLVFFVFNFATCYAMPWASVKQPWEGSRPGKDKSDLLGKFPLTHMHKFWAWLAVFSLGFHGILGFMGVFLGKWF